MTAVSSRHFEAEFQGPFEEWDAALRRSSRNSKRSSSTARARARRGAAAHHRASSSTGATAISDEHVSLFDDVFGLLIDEIEAKARDELSNHLAPVSNAPVKVVRRLANDDDIAVAGPVLQRWRRGSPRTTCVDVAETKSQAHLRAISGARRSARHSPTCWCGAATAMSRRACGQSRRRISDDGFSRLVSKRAETTALLAGKGRAAAGYSRRCSANC